MEIVWQRVPPNSKYEGEEEKVKAGVKKYLKLFFDMKQFFVRIDKVLLRINFDFRKRY